MAWRHARLWRQDLRHLAQAPSCAAPFDDDDANLPLVTLLVAAWNEAEHIEAHIKSVLALDYPHKELILCAGGQDGTYQLACRWAGAEVKVLEQQAGEGKYRALERSFRQAKGSVIVFSDADCLLNTQSLKDLIAPLIQGQEAVTTGRYQPLPAQQQISFVRYQWALQRHAEIMDQSLYTERLIGVNSAIKHSVLEACWQARALPEQTSADDLDLTLRLMQLGYRIRKVPTSVVETEYHDSFWPYIRQQSRWLRATLTIGYQFDSQSHVKQALLISLTGTFYLLLPPLAIFLRPVGLVAWLLSWLSVSMIYTRYMNVLNKLEEPTTPPFSPSLFKFMIAKFIVSARVWIELISPKWRMRW